MCNLSGSTWKRWSKIDDGVQKPYWIAVCEWCVNLIPCTDTIHPDPEVEEKGKGKGWVYRYKGPYW